MNSTTITLASKSPRRKQILIDAGYEVKVLTKETEETYPDNIAITEVPSYLAEKKAKAFIEESKSDLIITADTLVILNNHVLGKPADEKEAFTMIKSLSGKKHEVITGVSILSKGIFHTLSDVTEVYFRNLSDEEITFYIKNFKPFDKAGAYGIQEWIGMVGISKIVGSYYNVMGLPIEKVYLELKKMR